MDFMLNLPISAHNGDVQENSEVHMVREPHGQLEHVHLCDGDLARSQFSKVGFYLGKIWLYKIYYDKLFP